MCLLIVAYKKFPSREILQKAEKTNSDGAGISWIDKEAGVVRWKKGLKARELMEMCDLPLPVMIHFRKATVGKNIPELNHPFALDLDESLKLEGETKLGVLAHNGGWSDWASTIINFINDGNDLPKGFWSDSRAMAWAASIKGVDYLTGLSTGDKIAVMTLDGVERIGTWGLVQNDTGFCYSYNPFNFSYTTYYGYEDEYGLNRNYPPYMAAKPNRSGYFRAKEYCSFDDYYEKSITKDNKVHAKYKDWKEKTEKK